jgi:Flp pilus assembly protein CpaB
MNAKTRAILIAGLVAFVAGGAGAAYVATRDSGRGATASTGVKVLYTAGPVDAGTAASTAIAQGRIRTKTVGAANVPANAVRDPSELSGRVAGTNLAPNVLVTTDMFPAPQTRIGTVVIPPGKRALSLELQPVPGVSGFAGAGDLIDVYGVESGDTPGVRLILQGVQVLNVNGSGLPAAQGQPGSPDLVYLLAVTPAEAERLIYMTEFEKLYFDLIPKGEPPVTTPGAGPSQVLQAL